MTKCKHIPYTYPHRSRASKVAYICDIGGYSNRDGRWPIEFCVATYTANLDFDSLYATLLKEQAPAGSDTPAFKEACRVAYEEYKDNLWSWAQEDCYRDLHDSDTYRHLWDGTPLSVTLELHGRGGKHLVIAEFEGARLEGYTDTALHEALMLQSNDHTETFECNKRKKGYEWSYSDDFVDKLYKYCRQCAVDFTIKTAGEALQSAAAWHVCTRGESELEEQQARLADTEFMVGSARTLYDALNMDDEDLKAAWRDLCLAAGLTPSDIMF